jgi:hypothetical protein
MFFFLRGCLEELFSGALKLVSQLLFDTAHPKSVERLMGFHTLYNRLHLAPEVLDPSFIQIRTASNGYYQWCILVLRFL